MNYSYELSKNSNNYYDTKQIKVYKNNCQIIDPKEWINSRYETFLKLIEEQNNT
jgi:hypothetical protein